MTTSRKQLEEIAHQWISLWCTPVDWVLFDKLHADNFIDCSSAGRPADKAGFAAGLKELTIAFPDLNTVVEGLVIDQELSRVAVRWLAQGTNKATFLDIGPTNRKISITGIEIIEVADGQIIKRWGEWDITAHVEI